MLKLLLVKDPFEDLVKAMNSSHSRNTGIDTHTLTHTHTRSYIYKILHKYHLVEIS